jgi:hypothetical protein
MDMIENGMDELDETLVSIISDNKKLTPAEIYEKDVNPI